MGPVVELGSLTTANLMEKVKGLQNLAYQLGLEECKYMSKTNRAICITDNIYKIHCTLRCFDIKMLVTSYH